MPSKNGALLRAGYPPGCAECAMVEESERHSAEPCSLSVESEACPVPDRECRDDSDDVAEPTSPRANAVPQTYADDIPTCVLRSTRDHRSRSAVVHDVRYEYRPAMPHR